MADHTFSSFPKEISLCLSGGGARGAYHLGAISVLEQNNIAIKAISGTSIGALIGASLASGKSADEIFEIFCSKEMRRVFRFTFSFSHIFDIDADAQILKKLLDVDSFEALCIPLSVAVFDVRKEELHHINAGSELKKIVLASCALVPVFKAVEHNDMLLVDGGLVDNFPVEQLLKYPYPIIGINLYPSSKSVPRSLFGWIKKVIYLSWQTPNQNKKALCHNYISSQDLHSLATLSLGDMKRAFLLGKEAMQQQLLEDEEQTL